MKVVLNKVMLDKIGPYYAYIKIIKFTDDDPVVEAMLNATPRFLEDVPIRDSEDNT